MSVPSIDSQQFFRRASKIYKFWQALNDPKNVLSDVDSFVVAMGSNDDAFSKSISLIIWLCNYELADLILVFTKQEICLFTSKKKISFFKQLNYDVNLLPPIKYFIRDKSEKDVDSVNEIIEIIKKSGKKNTVGNLPKDSFNGEFVELWNKAFSTAGFKTVDISPALSLIMAEKEDKELDNIRKACEATSNLFDKLLKSKIIEIVDSEKKVKHTRIAAILEENISNSKYVADLAKESIDICYSPIIQSGGNYSLKFNTKSSQSNMQFDCIICSFGIRYKSYCSNIVRTLMVEPSNELQGTYNCLLAAEQAVIDSLTDGSLLSDAYEAGVRAIRSNMPEMVTNLTTNFGFLTGIEFRESNMVINASSTGRASKSMVFNVNIGLNDVDEKVDGKVSKVALFVGDVVVVNAGGPPTVLTSQKKQIKNIGIFIKSESSQEEEQFNVDELFKKPEKRSATVKRSTNGGISFTAREEKQKQLAIEMNDAARTRALNISSGNKEKKSKPLSVKSYSSVDQMPVSGSSLHLVVDRNQDTLVVPIFGVMTPFHISTIKNISQSIEGGFSYLRINFNLASACNDSLFVREMTFRSPNTRDPGSFSSPSLNLNTVFRNIKEVQRQMKIRETEAREREGMVQQDKLILTNSSQIPRIRDVYVRPNIMKKRCTGTLEAHTNGFRFMSSRGTKIEVLFCNVHKSFYQPSHNEMIILLHFVLKNSILVENKKFSEIQFYCEVGEIVSDLGKVGYSHDADELAAEQAEREYRNQMNSTFRSFCDRVQAISHQQIEFEVPLKDLGFYGNVFRGTSLLQPTSTCLVQLVDWPPFVLDLSTVEFAHFERVGDVIGKHCELVFVMKDYTKKVVIINAVPSSYIDLIKDWLTECDIRYTQGLQSLNWIKILKVASDDPAQFFEDGGWHFLDDVDDRSGEDNSSNDGDSDFHSTTSGDESSEDESESFNTGDDENETDEPFSDEESGKDWSELEEQAQRDDIRKQMEALESGRKRKMQAKSSSVKKRR